MAGDTLKLDTVMTSDGSQIYNFSQVIDMPNYVNKGKSLPGWRDRLAAGEQCDTDMEGKKSEVLAVQPIQATRVYFGHTLGYDGFWAGVGIDTNPNVAVLNSLEQEAITMLIVEAGTACQTLIGVTIAELGDTKNMIAKRGSQLLQSMFQHQVVANKLLRTLSNRRVSPVVIARELNDLYLEYRYGWLGLAYDIQGLTNAYNQSLTDLRRQRVKVNVKEKKVKNHSVAFGISNGIPLRQDTSSLEDLRCRAYGNVKVEIDSGLMPSLGLNPEEIFPTLYNLVPYSFVLDYFSNLEQFLTAVQLGRANLKWLTTIKVQKREVTYVYGLDGDSIVTGASYTGGSGKLALTSRWFSRTPRFEPPTPALVFHLPRSKVKWANLLSLIAQRALSSQKHVWR